MRKLLLVGALVVLLALMVGSAAADGPAIWVEKCPTLHYEVRIEQVEKGAVVVSCVRMAEVVR